MALGEVIITKNVAIDHGYSSKDFWQKFVPLIDTNKLDALMVDLKFSFGIVDLPKTNEKNYQQINKLVDRIEADIQAMISERLQYAIDEMEQLFIDKVNSDNLKTVSEKE